MMLPATPETSPVTVPSTMTVPWIPLISETVCPLSTMVVPPTPVCAVALPANRLTTSAMPTSRTSSFRVHGVRDMCEDTIRANK